MKRRAVYGVVITKDNKVVLIRTRGLYFLPGGGVEGEETDQECLIREINEELGYDIKIMMYLGKATLFDYVPYLETHYEMIGIFYVIELTVKKKSCLEVDCEVVLLPVKEVVDNEVLQLEHQRWALNEAEKLLHQKK